MAFMIRTTAIQTFVTAFSCYKNSSNEWGGRNDKVLLVSGPKGCGKTSLVLDFTKKYDRFYFSFAGLDDCMALGQFCKRTMEFVKSNEISSWSQAFLALLKRRPIVIFDDIASVASNEEFWAAFNSFWNNKGKSRLFLIMITEKPVKLPLLRCPSVLNEISWCTIADLFKAQPVLSHDNILRLYAVTGGIPELVNAYDVSLSFEDNLRSMLQPGSLFLHLCPKYLSAYFRRTEVYEHLLYAMVSGYHRISEIAAFTGFTSNKCDKYIKAMIECGIVVCREVSDKNKKVKTHYDLVNGYFTLWYRYVYLNRDIFLCSQPDKLCREMLDYIDKTLVIKVYREACLRLLPKKTRDFDFLTPIDLSVDKIYPQAIKNGNFTYTFDGVFHRGEYTLFFKIYTDPMENCGANEIKRIERAIMLTNKLYDSQAVIFCRRRFSDAAVAAAAKEHILSLVSLERLKY